MFVNQKIKTFVLYIIPISMVVGAISNFFLVYFVGEWKYWELGYTVFLVCLGIGMLAQKKCLFRYF